MSLVTAVTSDVDLGPSYCDPVSAEAQFWFCLKKKAHTVMWSKNLYTVYLRVCVYEIIVSIT